MKIEESKKINLLDKDENILCSLDAIYSYEDNDEDPGEVFYIHPMTGDYKHFANCCLQGWSEQDETDNINWAKLVEYIENEDDLLNRLYCSDEVNYFSK